MALEAWKKEHPPGKFGAHEYAKTGHGVTPEQIRERFADYVEAFPKILEGRKDRK